MTRTNKPNVLFWIIGIVALLWNAMGVFQYYMTTFHIDELMEGYNEQQLELAKSLPSWYNIVFAVAVIGGFLACIALLMKKKIAVTLFLISMIAVIVQMGYWLFFTNAKEIMGDNVEFMPITVIVVSILLFAYSKYCSNKFWLS